MLPWDTPIAIDDGLSYIIYPPHRNGHVEKSQWKIAEPEEVDCFRNAYQSKCCVACVGWGFYRVGGIPHVLGVSVHGEWLRIAKFVDSGKNNQWHGYPADYQRKRQDVPDDPVLQQWIKLKLINRRQAAKLKGGRPCGL